MSNSNKQAIIVKLKISTFIINNQLNFDFLHKCVWFRENTSHFTCTFVLHLFCLLVCLFCYTFPEFFIFTNPLFSSSSLNLLFSLYPYLFMFNPSFVWSQDQYLTVLLVLCSFVFLSHLTNFCPLLCLCMCASLCMCACFYVFHFAFEKEPARFEMSITTIL